MPEKFKYLDGSNVPTELASQITKVGEGKNTKRYLTITDNQGHLQQIEVITDIQFFKRILRFRDGNPVPAEILSTAFEEREGNELKSYVIMMDEQGQPQKIPIFTSSQLSANKLMFADRTVIPFNVLQTLEEVGKGSNKKRFVSITDEQGQLQKIEVFTAQHLRRTKLKYADRTDVPFDVAMTLEEIGSGKNIKCYVTVSDAQGQTQKIPVFTARQLYMENQKLMFADKMPVPQDIAQTVEEIDKGSYVEHYVTITDENGDTQKVQVYTALDLRNNRLKFADGSDVPFEVAMTLKEEGKAKDIKRYVTIETLDGQSQKVAVFTARQLYDRQLKFADGSLVPPDILTTLKEEGKVRWLKRFVTITTQQGEPKTVEVFTNAQLKKLKSKLKLANENDVHPEIAATSENNIHPDLAAALEGTDQSDVAVTNQLDQPEQEMVFTPNQPREEMVFTPNQPIKKIKFMDHTNVRSDHKRKNAQISGMTVFQISRTSEERSIPTESSSLPSNISNSTQSEIPSLNETLQFEIEHPEQLASSQSERGNRQQKRSRKTLNSQNNEDNQAQNPLPFFSQSTTNTIEREVATTFDSEFYTNLHDHSYYFVDNQRNQMNVIFTMNEDTQRNSFAKILQTFASNHRKIATFEIIDVGNSVFQGAGFVSVLLPLEKDMTAENAYKTFVDNLINEIRSKQNDPMSSYGNAPYLSSNTK